MRLEVGDVPDSVHVKYQRNQGVVTYTGGFEANKFAGKGCLEYARDGSKFEGEFTNHCKDGPAKFTLKNGRSYKGVFVLNSSDPHFDDFGPRF